MASFMCLLVVLFASAAMNTIIVEATQFTVGDSLLWQVPSNKDMEFYSRWASKHRFQVGDTLYFEYKQGDSVLVVDKEGYYHCNMTHPKASYKDGKTVIALDRPGPFYFISGNLRNCKDHQRLLVDVIAPRPGPPTAPPPPPSIPDHAPAPAPLPSSAVLNLATSPLALMALTTLSITVVINMFPLQL